MRPNPVNGARGPSHPDPTAVPLPPPCARQGTHNLAHLILKVPMDQERASMIERAAALALHRNGDELEIDDAALVSRADDGYWVQAWVWVPTPGTES